MSSHISNHLVEIIGIPLTLFFNALLVACEFSLIKIRFSHFNTDLKDQVDAHRLLRPLLQSGDRSIRVIRLGLTGCLILYALFSYPLLIALFGLVPLPGSLATAGAALLAFIVAVTVHQLVGEMFPRAVGLAYPLQSLKTGAPLVIFLGWLTRPIRLLVLGAVRFVWRVWRGESLPDLDSLDLETQIELLRKESPEMSMVAQLILKNTLMMRELVVADVLLPRNQVKYFDLNLTLEENLQMARESGHTRFPLCYGDLDRCLGLIHIKDIFRYPGDLTRMDLRRLKRNMIRIDSEEPLESALTKLLSHRMHMALVIDEFHGTEGLLTLERILEQLVGEIRDEFDADEEVLIKSDLKNDEAIVSGLTPLHEIESIFGTQLDTEEVSTIGGLVTSELGRIPEAGESVEIENLAIEVTDVDDTRVLEVRIRSISASDESEEESDVPGKGPDED
ncbi:HlyC/CorC family transporter [Puniceicoccales bacterium CK1056]|uniref:HlyC/CorC family transporter n=1 Tax=Oceanipulchritudo coccoides TaxID=2706888 RepID=A0A6B2LYD7_9BACT|nr:HlyC/CorC family transporter [Oceanipulchritudo coccoides]